MTEQHGSDASAMDVALIGFGEAAQAFTRGWHADIAATIRAYDVKTDTPGDGRAAMQAAYETLGVQGCSELADALAGMPVVMSFVTAEQAFAAAEAAAPHLAEGALFFDCNSCAPQTKQRSSVVVEAVGGRYVDAAVMSPVHPKLQKSPVLLSGPHAEAAANAARVLEMSVNVVEGGIGTASSIKLVRSIMVKGLEALSLECLMAGRMLGVDETVLASLEKTFPDFDWEHRTGYMIERAMTHGIRRAAEMREAAKMVDELGLDGRMAAATAAWQQTIGDLALRSQADPESKATRDRHLDNLIATLGPNRSS